MQKPVSLGCLAQLVPCLSKNCTALPFMYTERILRPYGSESTNASTGIFSVSFNFLKNNLHILNTVVCTNLTPMMHHSGEKARLPPEILTVRMYEPKSKRSLPMAHDKSRLVHEIVESSPSRRETIVCPLIQAEQSMPELSVWTEVADLEATSGCPFAVRMMQG